MAQVVSEDVTGRTRSTHLYGALAGSQGHESRQEGRGAGQVLLPRRIHPHGPYAAQHPLHHLPHVTKVKHK